MTSFAQTQIALPVAWNASAGLSLRLITRAESSGSVLWQVQALVCADTSQLQDYGAISPIIAEYTNSELSVRSSGNVSPSGSTTGGGLLFIRIARAGADASDTLTNTAQLLGLQLSYAINGLQHE